MLDRVGKAACLADQRDEAAPSRPAVQVLLDHRGARAHRGRDPADQLGDRTGLDAIVPTNGRVYGLQAAGAEGGADACASS
jgi:hypothetical protein